MVQGVRGGGASKAGQGLLAALALHWKEVVIGHLLVHQEVDVVLLVLAAQHLVKLRAELSKSRPQLPVCLPAPKHDVIAEGRRRTVTAAQVGGVGGVGGVT